MYIGIVAVYIGIEMPGLGAYARPWLDDVASCSPCHNAIVIINIAIIAITIIMMMISSLPISPNRHHMSVWGQLRVQLILRGQSLLDACHLPGMERPVAGTANLAGPQFTRLMPPARDGIIYLFIKIDWENNLMERFENMSLMIWFATLNCTCYEIEICNLALIEIKGRLGCDHAPVKPHGGRPGMMATSPSLQHIIQPCQIYEPVRRRAPTIYWGVWVVYACTIVSNGGS